MEATLDKFGRIVLPKKVRDDLELGPGAVLEVEEVGQEIILRPTREEPQLVEKGGVLVFAGRAAGDLGLAVKAQREERLDRLAGEQR